MADEPTGDPKPDKTESDTDVSDADVSDADVSDADVGDTDANDGVASADAVWGSAPKAETDPPLDAGSSPVPESPHEPPDAAGPFAPVGVSTSLSSDGQPSPVAPGAATAEAGERPVDPGDLCPLCGGSVSAPAGAADVACASCGSRVVRHRASGRWVPGDPSLRSADGVRRWRQGHPDLISPSLGLETCPLCLNVLRFSPDEDETTCGYCGSRVLRHRTTGEVLPADVRLRSQAAREGWRREHADVVVEREAVACPVCGEALQVLPYNDETACTRCGARLIRHRVNGEWISAPAAVGAAPGAAGASTKGSPGQAIAGFVCSVLGLLLVWVPFLGVVLAIVGIILSVTGRTQARARNAPTTLAVAGMVVGLVALGLWVILTVVGLALYA